MRSEEWWCGASYKESAVDYWNHVTCRTLEKGQAEGQG